VTISRGDDKASVFHGANRLALWQVRTFADLLSGALVQRVGVQALYQEGFYLLRLCHVIDNTLVFHL
jgi:hypothetical protein